MSWLVDADVLSQPMKKVGNEHVIAWLRHHQDGCYTSTIVIAQLASWVRTKQGRQRDALQTWLTRLTDAMHGHILGFSVSVAHVWAEQQHRLQRAGQRMPLEDSYLAAIATRHNLIIATGNEKDFRRSGLTVFNPFKSQP